MSPSTTQAQGSAAETYAIHYLEKNGYQLLARNYRIGKGEIDLIARKGKLLTFIEVKARTNLTYGYPETFVHPIQQASYHEIATHYIEENQWDNPIQFDIIALTPKGTTWELTHLEDAF